jgi:hypothetical protein
MGWYIRFRKYNKLCKEIIYCKSELEYRLELIREIHPEFEEYQHEYCRKHNIDIEKLKGQNVKVINHFNEPMSLVGNLSPETLSKEKKKTKGERAESKNFSYLYKRIAKKIHPDKLVALNDPDEIKDKEEMFKKASSAFKEHDWASLLEVADKLRIKPSINNLPSVCKEISKSIDVMREKIMEEEKRYGYLYAMCESEEEKEALMKRLLRQFFGISI